MSKKGDTMSKKEEPWYDALLWVVGLLACIGGGFALACYFVITVSTIWTDNSKLDELRSSFRDHQFSKNETDRRLRILTERYNALEKLWNEANPDKKLSQSNYSGMTFFGPGVVTCQPNTVTVCLAQPMSQ